MTLEKYLNDLADERKALRHSGLLQLSGLTSEGLFNFKSLWMSLSQSRKNEILSKLVGLGEDNLELDFNAVFRAALNDEDDDVREQATRGLWESNDRTILRPLINLLNNDPSPRVRAAVAMSLSRFVGMAQGGKLLSRDADRIRQALLSTIGKEDEDMEVRRRAIEAVASFNSLEIQQIIREAYNDGDPRLKQSAIFAMGRSSDVQWLPIILQEMRQSDPAVRYEAANACGQLGDESVVPHLATLIKDDDVQVQLSAVHAIGTIGGTLAKRVLIQCLKAGDETLEEAAQAALKSIEFDEDPLAFSFHS